MDRLQDLQEKLSTMLTQGEDGQKVAAINIKELPPEILSELKALRDQGELTIFDRRKIDQALPLQQLIQAETHGERLRVLETALLNEKARLEADAQESQGISLSEALEQGVFPTEDASTT